MYGLFMCVGGVQVKVVLKVTGRNILIFKICKSNLMCLMLCLYIDVRVLKLSFESSRGS